MMLRLVEAALYTLLGPPGTKACDAVGGAFRLEWREGAVRTRYLSETKGQTLDIAAKNHSKVGAGFTTNSAWSLCFAHHSFHFWILSGEAVARGANGGFLTIYPRTPTTQE